jgi:hypothetical protein
VGSANLVWNLRPDCGTSAGSFGEIPGNRLTVRSIAASLTRLDRADGEGRGPLSLAVSRKFFDPSAAIAHREPCTWVVYMNINLLPAWRFSLDKLEVRSNLELAKRRASWRVS